MKDKPGEYDEQECSRESEFAFEAMDEQEQALSFIQAAHACGMGGVQDLSFPAFFREVFEKR